MARGEDFSFVVERWEWASAREQRTAVGVVHRVLECAFGVDRWVRERKDDGPVVEFAHASQYVLIESTTNCRKSHQDSRLDVFDDIRET